MFEFLKYLQPTSYFSLRNKDGETIFPVVSNLPQAIIKQLTVDSNFKTEIAKQYDLSWQAAQKGFIGKSKKYSEFEEVALVDNYIFSRKYFSRFWVFYVLCLRLLSFNNPFTEIAAFYNSRNIKRSKYLKAPILYNEFVTYNSSLLIEKPKVSVIIPTLNRYKYLLDVLKDLEKQDYSNFEVIVVDQSQPFQKNFYDSFSLDLHVAFQEEKALWLARNNAIKKAKGNYVLLFDDDSRVDPDWISNHLKCLDFFNAEISSGVSISTVGAKVPEHYSFFRISDQLDTGNVLINKDVFNTLGLFDRQFEKQRMGDGEFGLRTYLQGFLNVSNPYAKRLHLKVDSGGLREMGSWDAFRTKKWFAPRPIPSVLYFFRKYFGNKTTKLALLRTVPLSIMPYKFKTNKSMMVLGVFVSLLLIPLVLFQVFKSWRLSSKKLKEGALIESYH
ncbi:glycosyltransferase family 2 protein [Lacinutrix gracilariae]|uniref:Glycosyltransferase family 2 protein n=1 Tax=Lacinutrix gracilariae TaxID=1747198 RepID=A0ABW5K0G4_9FLAO